MCMYRRVVHKSKTEKTAPFYTNFIQSTIRNEKVDYSFSSNYKLFQKYYLLEWS